MTQGQTPGRNALRRLVNKVDFERLLSERSARRSAHFALHHVRGEPTDGKRGRREVPATELSTGQVQQVTTAVDKQPPALWLGCIAPKRHARRAVTRNQLKRQMRGAAERHAHNLAPGLWLIRLRAPFAVQQFPSARSTALAVAARTELDALLANADEAPARPVMR